MFRDREEALQALQQQLLAEEEPEEAEADAQETPTRRPFDFDAYNTDKTDMDLEDYAEEVYAPKQKTGCAFWLLFFAVVILAIAYFLAKKEGLL